MYCLLVFVFRVPLRLQALIVDRLNSISWVVVIDYGGVSLKLFVVVVLALM